MNYTTKETAQKLGITKDTLLYYEKEGLLPEIKRDSKKRRMYSESDIEWIFLIRCLRDTDMPISKIKEYIFLLKEGSENSIQARRGILSEHQEVIQGKIKTYQKLLRLIEQKISYYDEVVYAANAYEITCTDYKTEWEHFRKLLGEQEEDES